MRVGDEEVDRSSELLLVPPISTTATQRRLLGVHTYGAGTPITGVLAPRARLGFGGKERRRQLGFVVRENVLLLQPHPSLYRPH